MSQMPESAIRVRIDPTNPGQFFACCGLLELAHRLWSGAEAWFEDDKHHFCLHPLDSQLTADQSPLAFYNAITFCLLANTMTESQLHRRDHLSSMSKKQIGTDPLLESEKKTLDALWREAPILLGGLFNLRIDWFVDERAGGDTFKTWAGQQSVIDIAVGMQKSSNTENEGAKPPEDWLFQRSTNECLPFNFDSDLGSVGGDRDVGFSFDPLKSIRVQTRPLVELLAFIGLQRFRPIRVKAENRYRFWLWFDPLVPEVAATAACGLLESPRSQAFEFRLLYRTKYLKSFLPATPISRSLQ
jgi:CRISPR-associated protein Csb3